MQKLKSGIGVRERKFYSKFILVIKKKLLHKNATINRITALNMILSSFAFSRVCPSHVQINFIFNNTISRSKDSSKEFKLFCSCSQLYRFSKFLHIVHDLWNVCNVFIAHEKCGVLGWSILTFFWKF